MIRFFTLRYRIAAITTLIAGILLTVIIWQGLFKTYEQAQLEKKTRQDVFLSFMEDICRTSLLREEYDVLQTYFMKLQRNDPTLSHLSIADHRGIIIASTSPPDLGRFLSTLSNEAGTPILHEVRNAAGLMGTISITFSESRFHEEFHRLINRTIFISLLGLIFLSLASIAVGFLLTRRLQNLTLGVQRIANGDLKMTVPEEGNDEVMLLGTAINRMTQRLLSLLSEMREQSERIQIVTDNNLDAIVTFDDTGIVQSMNPAALRIFGHQLPLPQRFAIADLIQEPPIEMWQRDNSRGDEGVILQLTGRRAGKDEFPVEAAVSRAFLSGRPLFIASIRDVSERKQFEKTLTRLNRELEQRVRERTSQLEEANKELETFSYSVSHDLRAPLRHISGFCQALETDCNERLDEQGLAYLQRVCGATKRMEELIDSLLALSRLGKHALHRKETDITSLAREVADELSVSNTGRQVEWRIASGLTAWIDPPMMRLVLQNLLGNAWKYTCKTSQGVITLEKIHADTETVFVVRDNGVGFDMRYADKLFAPFQRLHRQDDFEGVGVGLATVQRIIHRHGGRIWAESSPGEGASFFFSFSRE